MESDSAGRDNKGSEISGRSRRKSATLIDSYREGWLSIELNLFNSPRDITTDRAGTCNGRMAVAHNRPLCTGAGAEGGHEERKQNISFHRIVS
jgi:hypothetical protein